MANAILPTIIYGTPVILTDVNLNPTASLVNSRLNFNLIAEVSSFNNPILQFTTPDFYLIGEGEWTTQTFYRIWISPLTLNINNPQINLENPFSVWNAYPSNNILTQILSDNSEGLFIRPIPQVSFTALEQKPFTITITSDAPVTINSDFEFSFFLGEADFTFRTVLIEFTDIIPETPMRETWEWLTDIIVSHNSTEERISLRSVPRIVIQYSIFYEHGIERQQLYSQLYRNMPSRVLVPYYQYSTRIKQKSEAGSGVFADKIFFNPDETNVRSGQFVVINNLRTGNNQLVRLDEIQLDGATTINPLQQDIEVGNIITPAHPSYLAENTSMQNRSVSGTAQISASMLVPDSNFLRPGASPIIKTLDGLNILDRQPLARNNSTETFISNKELLDGDATGVTQIGTSVPHTFVSGSRQFLINRYTDINELDYWRQFLFEIKGRKQAFLFPTFLEDLTLAEIPLSGLPNLLINEEEYISRYFQFETYRRLRLELIDGEALYVNVLSARQTPGEATIELTIDMNVPFNGNISRISFLNLVRLNSDIVTLDHEDYRTTIQISMRTIDQ